MAEYLRYVIRNTEPVRIADDSTSQSGQTNTLRYIPGTTIRGLIVNALAAEQDFEQNKQKLFSEEIAYLNAYPMVGDKELLPSPKGFYEDKSEAEEKKKIENVVINGKFKEGHKRANLGRFSYIEEDCIRYFNVDTGSEMKIKMNLSSKEKQNVFRNEYMMPGQVFCGYIKLGYPELAEKIRSVFGTSIVLGNARSAGLGKCEVLSCEFVKELPYAVYLPTDEEKTSCYMMLLSNTAMRKKNGELCGIDIKQLEEKMGVDNLKIEFCSTSTVTVRGYNRTWQTETPSVVMFEQGSVFKLIYEGVLTRERAEALCNTGIGIRKNEGCGRILFLKDYEKVCYKQEGKKQEESCAEVKTIHKEDAEVLKQVAKRYYMRQLEHAAQRCIVADKIFQKGTVSNSQLGQIEARVSAYQYSPKEGKRIIVDYLEHSGNKEEKQNVQKQRSSSKKIKMFVLDLFQTEPEVFLQEYFDKPLGDTIMGIDKKQLLSEEEKDGWKLRLITDLIRYDNKKESR